MTSPIDTAERTLILSRVLNAPSSLVFEAWSKPQHLVQWFGPTDFTLPHCEQDFRVGGKYRFCMRAPDGSDHWVRGEYTHIDEPARLVFTWLREGAEGEIWCDTVVSLTFEERGKKTLMTLNQTTFATSAHREEHNGGWSECFERLAKYLGTGR